MLKEWKARKPDYFLVVFGEGHSDKYPLDGGVYPHDKGYISAVAGDVLLLYQNLGAPGVGVVIDVDIRDEPGVIYYQFFRLDRAAAWDSVHTLRSVISELRVPLNWKGNWIQKISNTSFQKALGGAQIKWL